MRAKVDALLRLVEARGAPKLPLISGSVPPPKTNVIAYSGGVDSTLAAKLVQQVFPETTVACLGISPSLSQQQLQQARDVAEHIRVPLWTCATTESQNEHYVANQGQSCYYCKTNLYTTINEVAEFAMGKLDDRKVKPVVYNGTNADDKLDPTRLGLVAASQFEVVSPLSGLTKNEVREVAKYLGLPNWNYAASPCLRSRLAFGVEAVEGHLKRVEEAEDFVRRTANLAPHHNMRVRFLTGNRAAVELESSVLESAKLQVEAINSELRRLGFDSVELRAFRSGSLSGYTPVVPSHHPS